MTLPETFTLVRHGYSEANAVQDQVKQRVLTTLPEGLFQRHDANMRLAARGVEQAKIAGEWLHANGPAFDRFYVSPHTRTRETAYHLHLDGQWRVEDRIRERDWGEIHYANPDLTDPLSESSRHNRELSQWYWKPMAGESLATGVRLRVESIMNSLYRKENTVHTIAVTHGEFMRATQFVIERMTPDYWEVMDKDPAYKMQNTMIVQYSRRNPNDSTAELATNYRWRRAICPWDENLSWDRGEWVELKHRKYSDDDLLASVEGYEPLF